MLESVCVMLRVILYANSCALLKASDAPFDTANVYIGSIKLGPSLCEDHSKIVV